MAFKAGGKIRAPSSQPPADACQRMLWAEGLALEGFRGLTQRAQHGLLKKCTLKVDRDPEYEFRIF